MMNQAIIANAPYSLIVHAGAHIGQEVENYRALGAQKILWIEADPAIFDRLKQNLSRAEAAASKKLNHLMVNAMIGARDGEAVDFHVFNNDGQSSSRFEPTDALKNRWAGLDVIGSPKKLITYRLQTAFASVGLQESDFANALLVLDLQGGEYEALLGLGDDIKKFAVVETEVSREQIYKGQKTFEYLDGIFNLSGFKIAAPADNEIPWHGDIVYLRNGLELALQPHLSKFFSALTGMREINKNSNLRTELSDFLQFCITRFQQSSAQLLQDLFVLFMCKEKRGGYFVEFGAADGLMLSNTLLLEKEYGWSGILAEPAKKWQADLAKNRTAAKDYRCVYKVDGNVLEFVEAENGELSTLNEFRESDYHADKRENGLRYSVETVSLKTLLDEHNAPEVIDYLSIDTEGSELEIIKSFDFSAYKFKIITVEHNLSEARHEIYAILTRAGYKRIFSQVSAFDDWYINPKLLP